MEYFARSHQRFLRCVYLSLHARFLFNNQIASSSGKDTAYTSTKGQEKERKHHKYDDSFEYFCFISIENKENRCICFVWKYCHPNVSLQVSWCDISRQGIQLRIGILFYRSIPERANTKDLFENLDKFIVENGLD